MSSNLPPVPHQIPMMDLDGKNNQVWLDFIQKLFIRSGGLIALTNDELGSVSTDRIVDSAVTPAKLASSVAGNGLTGGAGTALGVNVDNTTLDINSDVVGIKSLGVGSSQIAAGAVSYAKLLSTDWTNSQSSGGYQKLPSGIYIQWGITGSLSSATTTSTSFTTAFPTACLQVFASVRNNSGVATTSTGQWGTGNYSASAFDLYNRTSVALTFNWLAIGY